ncbi:MAG: hypothetical protein C3F02_01720 [Parcubacteria group bacterium]|nr:MAG: hypothetical protein C3F02_01720 [Parcubacteria group bacterium]
MKKAILFLELIIFLLAQPTGTGAEGLVFSEVMYDWPASDQSHEWVEIFNSGGPTAALLGSSKQAWRFFDGSNHTLSLAQGTTTIAASEYFILADDGQQFLQDYPTYSGTVFDTVMILPNTVGNLGLSLDGGATLSALVNYDSAWGGEGNGFSIEKINLNDNDTTSNWQESSIVGGSPGQANISHAPVVPLPVLAAKATCPSGLSVGESGIFDASGSVIPANEIAIYEWSFSDNQTATSTIANHVFASAGTYQVILKIGINNLESQDACSVEVSAEEPTEESGNNSGGGSSAGNGPNNTYSWSQIRIAEFLPNPKGPDDGEWIELFNQGAATLDLSGFALQDNSTKIFTIGERLISAQSYALFYKDETGLSLNNSGGDAVKLYDPNGGLVETVTYQDNAPEGKSYARQNDSFSWTSSPTPGQANIFVANQAPTAKIKINSGKFLAGEKIVLSAEESSDPEESKLIYQWDFGDDNTGDEKIENHIYETAGTFAVHLKVKDAGGLENGITLPITIEGKEEKILLSEVAPINFALGDLIISEFLPDPVGSDDSEWIELYNNSTQNIKLTGWQLDDAAGGSNPYVFLASSTIAAGSFLVVNKKDSKISLNNQGDSVRLLTPLGDVWQQADYSQIPEGQSQAWDLLNQEWFISTVPSPGGANIATATEFALSPTTDLQELKNQSEIWLELVSLQNTNPQSSNLYTVRLSDQGVDYNQVVEIYLANKKWPDIKVGDILTISGQLSNNDSGPRLKIKSKEQLVLTGEHQDLLKPELTDLDTLGDDLANSFISLSGYVVKKNGKNIYLASSVGEDYAVRAYLDFDCKDLAIVKGNEIVVNGILQNTKNGWKLLVKNKDDILLAQQVLGTQIAADNSSEQNTTTTQISSSQRKVKYFLVTLLGLIVILIVFKVIKKYRYQKRTNTGNL